MPTELVLRLSQNLPILIPTSVFLGSAPVAPYQSIRVLADCTVEDQPVLLTLSHMDAGIEFALDRITLTPGAWMINQVYEVPGTTLGVSAAPANDAEAQLNVYIWGYRVDAAGVAPDPNVAPKVDGTLNVIVVESDGTAAGPDIEVFLDGFSFGWKTGANGSVSVTRLESAYEIFASHPDGRESQRVGVTIVGNETNDVTITLPAP